jgi:hypothetical protein
MESSIIMTKSRKVRWMGHVASIKETKNVYKFLVRKTEGLKQFGKPKCYRVVKYKN